MQKLDDSAVGSPASGPATLSDRDRAILRAVGRGSAEVVVGAQPDLFLDGRCCCDQLAARRLVHAGLIAPAVRAAVGQRVAAQLTRAGRGLVAPAGGDAVVRRLEPTPAPAERGRPGGLAAIA